MDNYLVEEFKDATGFEGDIDPNGSYISGYVEWLEQRAKKKESVSLVRDKSPSRKIEVVILESQSSSLRVYMFSRWRGGKKRLK